MTSVGADLRIYNNDDLTNVDTCYGEVPAGAFDGDPTRLTEMDALVAYLQMLGTTAVFTKYEPLAEENNR